MPGRKSAEEVTCFINNIGLGIQFAAVGSAIYAEARAKGVAERFRQIGFWSRCIHNLPQGNKFLTRRSVDHDNASRAPGLITQ